MLLQDIVISTIEGTTMNVALLLVIIFVLSELLLVHLLFFYFIINKIRKAQKRDALATTNLPPKERRANQNASLSLGLRNGKKLPEGSVVIQQGSL